MKRRTVTKEIKSDPTACEDFLLIVKGHVLQLMMEKFNLESLDGNPPSDSMFGAEFMKCNEKERTATFMSAVGEIISEYTHCFELDRNQNVKDNYHVNIRNVVHGVY